MKHNFSFAQRKIIGVKLRCLLNFCIIIYVFFLDSSPIDAKPVLSHNGDDEPIELAFNPYDKEPRKCILCKHQVILDYKNTRLLQQFVSSFRHFFYNI